MDQHPIPQNVTGFQFKLIGSMTVKQFGYVASGVILAAVIYYLPLKGVLSIFLKIILIPLFGSMGAIVAFLPIDGRPVDLMIGNLIQALFSPNQYIYRKAVKSFSFSTVSLSRQQPAGQKDQKSHYTPQQDLINQKNLQLQKLLVKNSTHKIKNDLDAREVAYLNTFSVPTPALSPVAPALNVAPAPIAPAQPIMPPKITMPVPSPTPSMPNDSSSKNALEKELELAKQDELAPHNPQDLLKIHQKVLDLEKQIHEANTQKNLLEKEIVALKSQLPKAAASQPIAAAPMPQPQPAPVQPAVPAQKPAPHVRTLTKEMNKNIGILTSDTPNVITGIVKDARGNVLQNILVEIKDQKGNPVRAFKTNSLGNFASATPLAVGTYTIMLEDLKKQHTFDTIQFTTNNQIMSPIEIISYDKREELRKELFN